MVLSSHLQVAVLAETDHQQKTLERLIIDNGYRLQASLLAEDFHSQILQVDEGAIDAWLITLHDGDSRYDAITDWLLELDTPAIVDGLESEDAVSVSVAWQRRMIEKLRQLQGSINLSEHPEGAAEFVWVLGASTGGPEAVKTFFNALPEALGVGFIYVQHIDPGYEQILVDIVNKHGHYPAYPVTHGDVLPPNKTAIISSNDWVEVLVNGTMALKQEKWPGAYSPSIDQVFANVARSYGSRCGVIVFTGMADDGALGVRLVHQQGGKVWAQSPSSCTISSMPDAALDTGVVTVVASPEGLAAKLTEFMRDETREIQ